MRTTDGPQADPGHGSRQRKLRALRGLRVLCAAVGASSGAIIRVA